MSPILLPIPMKFSEARFHNTPHFSYIKDNSHMNMAELSIDTESWECCTPKAVIEGKMCLCIVILQA